MSRKKPEKNELMSLGLLIVEGGRLVDLLFQMASGSRAFAAIVSEDQ
jgi:hypothetical protein